MTRPLTRFTRFALCLSGLLIASIWSAAPAQAFCGFYVSGADAELYNNATQVVLMRSGTRTVLSMQNNYQGPPADFAMVVPVPVVLQEDNVKTLPQDVFQRVDRLAAPRLVEYWEQDPCNPYAGIPMPGRSFGGTIDLASESINDSDDDLGVTIEAQFTVGEYEIVILSAVDSTGLDTWLKRERYRIPDGAEPLLKPYVAAGMKFFVAKVNADKVTFKNGQAMLSPLRFYYDSEQFNLPIRLGLMNANDKQDLLVHILAPRQRYEVANYANVTIPTNIDVTDATRNSFGAFYAALFDSVQERYPGSVVTEYSWGAGSCDPCPSPPLTEQDLITLGGDVVPGIDPFGVVLTRLHARYDKNSATRDLVFRQAPAIVGGREVRRQGGAIERGAASGSVNNFQGRYIIRHEWTGPITCQNPKRGIWGGKPGRSAPEVTPVKDVAFVPRGRVQLASFLADPVASDDFRKSTADPEATFDTTGIPPKAGACGGCRASGPGLAGLGLWLGLMLGGLALSRRRSRSRR